MSVISQLFGVSQTGQVTANSTQTQQQATDARGQEYLSRLSGGQTVEGRIADIKGNDVQIELPNGGTVSARLDNAMALTKGQSVTFEVRTNSGSQVSLTPLYTNLNLSATATKALQAAGMTVNADTLRMTMSMMDEGLGIDRSSLGDMYNLISAHQGADIRSLVEMQHIGMEINETTIEQYGAFKNYENQLSDGMREIAESALSLYDELAGSGDQTQALGYLRELTELFTAEEAADAEAPEAPTAQAAQAQIDPATGKVVLADVQQPPEAAEVAGKLEVFLTEAGAREEVSAADAEAETTETTDAAAAGRGAGAEASLRDTERMDTLRKDEAEPGRQSAVIEGSDPENVLRSASEGALGERGAAVDTAAGRLQGALAELVARQGGSAELAAQIRELEPTDRNMLKLSGEVLRVLERGDGELKNSALARELRDFIGREDFREVVKNTMRDSWTLRPEQVGDKANVENLYQKLNAQTKELTQMLTQIARPESALAQNLSNMSNNLDFMNQMNQMYQYVQLPLKMNGSEATGDLFVYSDKKSLASKDGNVSALLHLDMQHLGAIDVYAAISPGNKVSTRFYLESDEMIDFIAEHIHILNERLEARGYSVKADITKHDEADEGSAKVRKLKETAGGSVISKRSFDVRA